MHVWVALPVRLHVLTAAPDPGIVLDPVELTGYARTLEMTAPGDLVFPLSDDEHCSILIAGDRSCQPWLPEQAALRRRLSSGDPPAPEELVDRLRDYGIGYVIADPSFHHRLTEQLGPRHAQQYRRRLLDHPAVTVVLTVGSDRVRPAPSLAPFYLLQITQEGRPAG
jgi:hypothetical protein